MLYVSFHLDDDREEKFIRKLCDRYGFDPSDVAKAMLVSGFPARDPWAPPVYRFAEALALTIPPKDPDRFPRLPVLREFLEQYAAEAEDEAGEPKHPPFRAIDVAAWTD